MLSETGSNRSVRSPDGTVDLNQKLRGILENAIVPIIVIGVDGHLIEANPAFFKLLGYLPEDLLGLNIRSLSSPEDPNMFDQVVAGEIDSYVVEKHYQCKDGLIVDVIVSASALKDPEGRLHSVVAVIQDMSNYKALERNLVEEKQLFESLLRNLPVGVNYVRENKIAYTNPAFCRITGYTESEILGRSPNIFYGQDSPVRIVENFPRLLRKETNTLHTEMEARNKAGETLYIESINTVGYIDGQDCLIGIINDITARKQLEARYGLLFEAANDSILVLDPVDLQIIDANPKAIELYEYSRKELLRMSVTDITLPNPPKIKDLTSDATDSEQISWPVGVYPRIQIRKDGERIPVEVSSALTYWEGKKAIISIIRDVTEQRRLQQQLMQADKLASLGSLVAGIAHEINNPNNFITFNIPILEDYWKEVFPILDAYAIDHPDWMLLGMSYAEFRLDVIKLLNNMEHGSERINNIVGELRNFARIQKDEFRALIDIHKLVDRVITLTGKQVGKLVKSYRIELADNLPEIVVNPARIEQVLINLVLNAAQAADKEDSYVLLNIRKDPLIPFQVVFSVEDNGSGMDESVRARIFDPFFTTKDGVEGTGLGLSISYAIIQDHGGNISVTSLPGRGTTVNVNLPIGR
jgi:hypothetical protein